MKPSKRALAEDMLTIIISVSVSILVFLIILMLCQTGVMDIIINKFTFIFNKIWNCGLFLLNCICN